MHGIMKLSNSFKKDISFQSYIEKKVTKSLLFAKLLVAVIKV